MSKHDISMNDSGASNHHSRLDIYTDGVSLPFEVRTRTLGLVARGRTERSLSLPAGEYVVSVRLPGDEGFEALVDVKGNESPVVLRLPVERRASSVLGAGVHSGYALRGAGAGAVDVLHPEAALPGAGDAARAVALLAFGRPRGHPSLSNLPSHSRRRESGPYQAGGEHPVFLRCLQLGISGDAQQHPPPKLIRVRDEGGLCIVQAEVDGPGVLFMQVEREGESPLVFALPAIGAGTARSCDLVMSLYDSAPRIFPYFDEPDVDLANAYITFGEFEDARALLGVDAPRRLLGRIENPVAASCAALLCLRLGLVEDWERWSEENVQACPWLPDAGIIAGEARARAGDHQNAFFYFEWAVEHGLPILTESFSLLLSRLMQYASEPGDGLFFGSNRTRIEEMLSVLRRWTSVVDYQEPLLSFRAELLPAVAEDPTAERVDLLPLLG